MSTLHGRKIRIPEAGPGMVQPAAGKIGTLSYAGWSDQYFVYVDGTYYIRASASELEPHLIAE